MATTIIYIIFTVIFLIAANVLLKDPNERVQSWVSFCTAAVFFAQALAQFTNLGK